MPYPKPYTPGELKARKKSKKSRKKKKQGNPHNDRGGMAVGMK